jgi:tetratricopeptide (TPR) repeat protein
MNRKFHPWEGGEGKVTSQYIYCHVEIGKKLIDEGKYEEAIENLTAATIYPHNLGEGKLLGAQENNINYYLGFAYKKLDNEDLSKAFFTKASIGLSEPTSAMYYNDQPPEMIFYQGMALKALGDLDAAKSRFNKLIDYGEKHIFDNVTIDYFAVSLPDFLIFDEDLNKRNLIHCNNLIALGYLGLEKYAEARECFSKVLELDVNHLLARTHMMLI